jgi:hypothetical protein
MPNTTCNFFAILKDNSIRKIDLLQNITNEIRNIFIDNSLFLMDEDTLEIKFDGNYAVQEEEVLFVDLILPENIIEAKNNPIGLNVLNLDTDDVKALFWVENDVYYFQNFDNRKLLRNKNVIFYDNNSYNKLVENALIVENVVNAIHKNDKLYFKSYANANKIFSLMEYFEEASNEEIDEFAKSDKLIVDTIWLRDNANTLIRKQITLIQKSNILIKANPKRIQTSAGKFKLIIELDNGKLKLPNDKKHCKDILSFLNEQYYIGLITKSKYRTNSKRNVD